MPDVHPADSYRAHRSELLAASVPTTARWVFAATLLFEVGLLLAEPARLRNEWVPNLTQLLIPVLMWWLARGPLRDWVENVVLGTYLAYTTVLICRLLLPATSTSGTALFVSVMMLGAALFVPWGAGTQWFSACFTLLLYWGMLMVAGRPSGFGWGETVHQLIGPLIAALLSGVGAAGADRIRRSAFEHRKRLEESDAHVRLLLESVADGIMVTDGRCILFSNAPLATMLGYGSDKDLAGLDLRLLAGEESYPALEAYLQAAVKREPFDGQIESRFSSRSGGSIDVSLAAAPLRYEDSPAVQVMVRDITERKRTDAEREEQSQISAALARVGSELIALQDTGEILDRLCHLTAEVLKCDSSHTFLWEEEQQTYVAVAGYGDTAEQWESARLLRVPLQMITEFQSRLEQHDTVQLLLSDPNLVIPTALLNQFGTTAALCVGLWRGGKIIGVHVAEYRGRREPFSGAQTQIARGIAHLASLALETARLVEELGRANRVKSEFVATMSHELRTPLGVVTGYHELLLDGTFGPLTDEQLQPLRSADRSARELLDLINATLNLSRLEAKPDALDIEALQAEALVDEVAEEFPSLAMPAGVDLVWNAASNIPVFQSDRVKLKMILKNLIGNAIKFTERGSVRLDARACDGGVEFSVSDTGPGIPPEAREHVFEAFRQVDGTQERGYGGAGLGLYIVRRLLEMLQGTITLESELGKGTSFRVWLPERPEEGNNRLPG